MGQYPGIAMGSVLGGDGAGVVIASGNTGDPLLNKRVFLTPSRGWEKAPHAPESRYGNSLITLTGRTQFTSSSYCLNLNLVSSVAGLFRPLGLFQNM